MLENVEKIQEKIDLRQKTIRSIYRKAMRAQRVLDIHEKNEIQFYEDEISRLQIKLSVLIG